MGKKLNLLIRGIFFILLMLVYFLGDAAAQESLTLDRALEIAMENSPDIKHLELNIERSRKLLAAKNASLKTQFSLTLTPFSYDQTRQFDPRYSDWYSIKSKSSSGAFTFSQPIKWTDGTLALVNEFSRQEAYSDISDKTDRSFRNNLYISFKQPLFTYNRTMLDLNNLRLDLENNALRYAIQKLYLEFQVTQNFYGVYQQKANLDVAIEDYNNRQQSYSIIKNKVDAGLTAREELYQAELDLLKSKASVQDANTSLENSLDTFKKLIGLSIFSDITVTANITHQPIKVDVQKASDTALKYRMELRQREIDIESAKNTLIVQSATNEFKGNLNFYYGIIGTNENIDQLFKDYEKSQGFFIQFNIPFIDWGYRKSTIEAYKASVKSSELSLTDQKNDIVVEVRNADRNLKNLINQIEIAEQNVKNAQLTYDINLERYKNGDITSMDLNLFQNQLTSAKISKVKALISYKLELLNMKVLSLYDFEKDRRVVPEILTY